MLYRLAVIVVFTTFLNGCATGYHSTNNALLGWTGGYWDSKGPGKLTKVEFVGNGFIDKFEVGRLLMYRCAELTIGDGKDFFVMYESIKDAIEDNPLHMSYGRRGIDGKPIAYAYILMSNEKTERAHSAAEVIEKYSSSVSRL